MSEITMGDIQDLKRQRQELISDIEKLENKLKNLLQILLNYKYITKCYASKKSKRRFRKKFG